MISQHCPRCGSSCIRQGYGPTPFLLKLICRYNLLCDNCNWPFRGFVLPGTVGLRSRKKRRSLKNETARIQVASSSVVSISISGNNVSDEVSIKNEQTTQPADVIQSFDYAEAGQDLIQTEINLEEETINLEEETTKNESENFNHQSPPPTPLEGVRVDDGSRDSHNYLALQGTSGATLSAGDDQCHGVADSSRKSRSRRNGSGKHGNKKSTKHFKKIKVTET